MRLRGCRARMQIHANAVAGAKRDERLRDNCDARHELKTKPLRNGSNRNSRFKQRESLADAAPRTVSKREIGAGGQPLREAIEPALGAEGIRLVVIARIALRHPLRKYDR